MHESSFEASQKRKTHLKSIRPPLSNYKEIYLKRRKHQNSKKALPDLKPDEKKQEQNMSSLKSNIPLLPRDPEELKMIKS